MNTNTLILIDQTYYFPQKEDLTFVDEGEHIQFHVIRFTHDVSTGYGSPLKFTLPPKISENIVKSQKRLANAIEKNDYKVRYPTAIVQKVHSFQHVMHEAC